MIDFAKKIKDNLNELGVYLTRELTRELLQQGHKATGSLIKSISQAVEFYKNALVLIIEYNDYGAVINNGVKPAKIPFGKKGGGGKSAYIQGLYDWVFNTKKLATTEKEALGITFAIAHTHREYGMPTPKSFSFSSNGRRVGFQDYVLAEKSDEIINLIQKNIDEPVWATFDQFLTKNIAA
jgi:hypothetical protein